MSKFTQLKHPEEPEEDSAGWIRILVTRCNAAEPALSDRYTSQQETDSLSSLHIRALMTESTATQQLLKDFFADIEKHDRKTYDFPLTETGQANHEEVKTPFFAVHALQRQLMTTRQILWSHRGWLQLNERTAEESQKISGEIDSHLDEMGRTLAGVDEGLKEARKPKE